VSVVEPVLLPGRVGERGDRRNRGSDAIGATRDRVEAPRVTGSTRPPVTSRETVAAHYRAVRATTEAICRPLEIEDYGVQSMDDVSPPKWHLGHTTWFFERMVLIEAGQEPWRPDTDFLFNSYYESVGRRIERPQRGLVSRPPVREVYEYRAVVDERMRRLFGDAPDDVLDRLAPAIEIGLHHEQQHQELLVTDIKHILCTQATLPVYRPQDPPAPSRETSLTFTEHPGGLLVVIGAPDDGFAYDNERPRHQTFLRPFQIADRPVTNREYREFIEAGGYRDFRHWTSDGWAAVQTSGWTAPLYWKSADHDMSLAGLRTLDPNAPVAHISWFEADAYARWRGKRLATEQEWEVAAQDQGGTLLDDDLLHPQAPGAWLGDVWEWTASAYLPYPGFQPFDGKLAEYNGKFMSGQMVLRGGSCATPRSHLRRTYRNFFQPDKRWQFSGARLAE